MATKKTSSSKAKGAKSAKATKSAKSAKAAAGQQQSAEAKALTEQREANIKNAASRARYDADAEESAAKARSAMKSPATALAEEHEAGSKPVSKVAEARAQDHKRILSERQSSLRKANLGGGTSGHSRGKFAEQFADGSERPLTADLPQEIPVPGIAALHGAMRRGYFPDAAAPKNIPPAHVSDNIAAISPGPFGDEGPSGAGEGGVGLPATIGSPVQ